MFNMVCHIALVVLVTTAVALFIVIILDAIRLTKKENSMDTKELQFIIERFIKEYVMYNMDEDAYAKLSNLGLLDAKSERWTNMRLVYVFLEDLINNDVGTMDRGQALTYCATMVPGFYEWINSKFI